MANYITSELIDSSDCREVLRAGGPMNGTLLGYVIYRALADEKQWFAYRLDAADDLVFQGRYVTAGEAAKIIGDAP